MRSEYSVQSTELVDSLAGGADQSQGKRREEREGPSQQKKSRIWPHADRRRRRRPLLVRRLSDPSYWPAHRWDPPIPAGGSSRLTGTCELRALGRLPAARGGGRGGGTVARDDGRHQATAHSSCGRSSPSTHATLTHSLAQPSPAGEQQQQQQQHITRLAGWPGRRADQRSAARSRRPGRGHPGAGDQHLFSSPCAVPALGDNYNNKPSQAEEQGQEETKKAQGQVLALAGRGRGGGTVLR